MRHATSDAYAERVNRVLDYVNEQPAADLTLEALARVACFSPFHFHRVFKSYVGENLNPFVRRARLERAVARLRASPGSRLTAVALDCGFSSSSDFSRAFKRQYGIPPGRWDRTSALENSKIGEVGAVRLRYPPEELGRAAEKLGLRVSVSRVPERRVAYVRVVNPYGNAEGIMTAYRRVISWARERLPESWRWTLIGMSQDDPDVTPLPRCRYDVCVTVPSAPLRPGGDISLRTLPGGAVASLPVQGDMGAVSVAWDYLFRWWLPRSRWQPADLPAMEIYRQTPDEIGWEKFDLECCVPLVPF